MTRWNYTDFQTDLEPGLLFDDSFEERIAELPLTLRWYERRVRKVVARAIKEKTVTVDSPYFDMVR